MLRRLALLPVLLLASCATAEEDLALSFDGSTPIDARTDTGSGDDTGSTPPVDSTVPDTAVSKPDTAVSVPDTTVSDTFIADTFVADTFVPDTYKPDTFVADTYVPDTSVADTTPTDAAGCTGVIADWNWNAGTGPTTLVKSATTSLWAIGPATSYGPKDGATYLATNPNVGSYVDGMREWVRLPTIPLGAYAACKIKISVEVWRYCEGLSTTVDGGNLQFTAATDASTATDWKAVDGTSMSYDGVTTASACSSSTCLVYNQKLWAGRATPYAKSGTFTSTAAMGSQLTFRFTFFSDASLASYDGLYVKSLKVEAVP